MEFVLKNVGVIENSTIKIDGITVITGPNNSGKSTIGKALHAIIDATENIEELSLEAKLEYVLNSIRAELDSLQVYILSTFSVDKDTLVQTMLFKVLYKGVLEIGNLFELEKLIDSVVNDLKQIIEMYSKNESQRIREMFSEEERDVVISKINKAIEKVKKLTDIVHSDPTHEKFLLNRTLKGLKNAFRSQIAPVRKSNLTSHFEFIEQEKTAVFLNIEENKLQSKAINNMSDYFDASIYVDNLVYLDKMLFIEDIKKQMRKHKKENNVTFEEFLMESDEGVSIADKIFSFKKRNEIEEILTAEKAKLVLEKINQIISGEVFKEKGIIKYSSHKLDINNLSNGSKSILLIKLLIENDLLNESTMLILDEAECALHPEWQNIFAEILVLLRKELGVRILLTTHSDKFVLALETFIRKYEMNKESNFYMPQYVNRERYMLNFKCVNEKLNAVYEDLSLPNDRMRILRNSLLILTDD